MHCTKESKQSCLYIYTLIYVYTNVYICSDYPGERRHCQSKYIILNAIFCIIVHIVRSKSARPVRSSASNSQSDVRLPAIFPVQCKYIQMFVWIRSAVEISLVFVQSALQMLQAEHAHALDQSRLSYLQAKKMGAIAWQAHVPVHLCLCVCVCVCDCCIVSFRQ